MARRRREDREAAEACGKCCCECISFTITLVCVIVFFTGAHPKVRVSSLSLESLKYVNSSCCGLSPSFTMVFNAEFAVKNKNLIEVKLKSTKATVSYRGTDAGTTPINGLDVGSLKKEKFNVTLHVNSDKVPSNDTRLLSDLQSKNLTFSAYAKFKSEVNWILKKSSKMNCTFVVNIETRKIIPLKC